MILNLMKILDSFNNPYMNCIKRNFSMITFPYNFDPNETLISHLTDF